jgi:drug/metabolite transporter (DMT)-like permease
LAVLLLFQFSWMLPLIGWAGGQGRPTRRQWTAIAAILAGTLLAVGIAHPVRWPWVGMSLGLAAGLAYALTLYGQGRLPPETPPGPPSLISSLVAGVIVLTAYHPWAGSAISLSWRAVLYGSLAGLFSTALPLVLVYRAARSLGSALTAILASLELPAAVVLSRIWLGERVTPTRWLGVAVMLAAIIYGAWPKPPPELELE